MADYLPDTWNIPAIKTGDTWDGFTISGVTVNSANPANTLSNVAIQFRTAPGASTVALELNTTTSGITINNATTWNCTVNSMTVSLDPDTYWWDMQFTDSAGKIKTYLEGKWPIVRDVTR